MQLHARETIGITWNVEALRPLASDRTITLMKAVSTAFWFGVLAAAIAGIIVLAGQVGAWFMLTHAAVVLWVYVTLVHAVPATPPSCSRKCSSSRGTWPTCSMTSAITMNSVPGRTCGAVRCPRSGDNGG